METYIPNYNALLGKATGTISDLLNGTPSPSTTRNAAATFGVENGLGTGSGVVNRYGYDLYNQEGQQRQAQGAQELGSLIGTVSQPTLENQGQNLQNNQFYSNLDQQANEFNTQEQMQQLDEMIRSFGQFL